MTRRVLLDTNNVSNVLNGHPQVVRRLVATPMALLCISAVTAGELQFGLAKRPQARRLRAAVEAFLLRVDVLPWSRATAVRYGALGAELTRAGKLLAPLDMLIAAQALEADAILVTNDASPMTPRSLRSEDCGSRIGRGTFRSASKGRTCAVRRCGSGHRQESSVEFSRFSHF